MVTVNPPSRNTDAPKAKPKVRKPDKDVRKRNPVTPGIDDVIGEACIQTRLVRGWKRTDLSRECGVSMETLGNLERGEQAWSAAHVVKVAKACGVQPSALYIAAGLEVPSATPEEAALADTQLDAAAKNQLVRFIRALRTAQAAEED